MRIQWRLFIVLAVLGGALAAAPAPDPIPRAKEAYRHAEGELQELERSFTGQRVKARLEIAKQKDAIQQAERDAASFVRKKGTRMDYLEDVLGAIADPTSERAGQVRGELEKLQAAAAARKQAVLKTQKDLIEAEENLRLLERQQDLQRRKALARLESAEAKLRQLQGDNSMTSEQRLKALEKKIDALLRDMADLRHEAHRQTKDP